MFTAKANHSNDLMALLTGQAAGGKSGGLEALLSQGQLPKDQMAEFSNMLADQGALEGISKNDLLQFFKNSGSGDLQAQEDLFQFMDSAEGKNLLQGFSFDGEKFVSTKGEQIAPDEILAKLESLQESVGQSSKSDENADKKFFNKLEANLGDKNSKVAQLKTGEDFLASKKVMEKNPELSELSKQNDTSDNISQNNSQNNSKKTHPSMNTYMKSSQTFKKQFIEAKGEMDEKPNVKSTEFSKVTESKDGFDNLDLLGNDRNIIGMEKTFSKNVDGNQVSTKSHDTKVLDLSNISANNKAELIGKIGNYIEQSYMAGKDSVEMVINHEELGQFRVLAEKSGPGNQVNLQIDTMTKQGQQFFVENESEMVRTLTQNGIKLSDVKIVAGNDMMLTGESRASGNDSFSQSHSQSQGRGESGQQNQSQGQFGGNQNGEERRRQLWRNAQEYQQSLSA